MAKKSQTYDTSKPILDVHMFGRRVGTLGQHDSDVWFRYDEWVISEKDPSLWALSVRLSPTAETFGHNDTLAFFDNLLLETGTRDELANATKFDATNLPGLLGRVGAECAGAVSVWPTGVAPAPLPEYQPLTPPQVAALFDERHGERLTQAQIDSQQTMSGVQRKLVFRSTPSGYELPLKGAPSTVIIKRASSRYPGLVANEMACLQLFGELGLPVPKATMFPAGEGLLEIVRYDRIDREEIVERLHQEDFCQATGRIPARKYQKSGGPGFKDIADVLRRHAANPAEDIEKLIRAAITSLCLGNMDAHAKNYSLLYIDGVPRLAPFYDIVCTEAFPGLDQELSMNYGTVRHPKSLSPSSLERMAKDLAITPRFAREVVADVVKRVPSAWAKVSHEVAKATKDEEMLQTMSAIVAARLKDANRLLH